MFKRFFNLRNNTAGKLLPFLTGETLDFKRIWLLSFILTAGFSIIPLLFFAAIDYNLTYTSMDKDAVARTSRRASNSWRSVSFFIEERKNALSYVVNNTAFDQLSDPAYLSNILVNLKKSFGEFTDIGVVNKAGDQIAYAGPYGLAGKNYSGQSWFDNVMAQGTFVSEVFMGFRNTPHIALAIRHTSNDGQVFILRATMEDQLTQVINQEDKLRGSDVFLVNTQGVLQTPSDFYGEVLTSIPFTLPPKSGETRTFRVEAPDTGEKSIVAYRYIPDTPFVIIVMKPEKALMAPWHDSQMTLLKYLGVSITIIVLWIWWLTTFLVQGLQALDRKRAKYFHLAEYANKMASIGRLAAGVAHETNNPLAIINEKAGLMKDLMALSPEGSTDPRYKELIDSILESVARCGRITKQLLNFGRHTHNELIPLKVKQVVEEVLIFLAKEAEFRSIGISTNVPDTLPKVVCDHGKLQQIFLNIINNALSAMDEGGKLEITAENGPDGFISVAIADDGCGISEANLEEIFEPFFSTKTATGGTGLGLSITYGLVQELGGQIQVKSKENQGTTFTVLLPLTAKNGDKD
ncbi:MAG: two-component sensor histidine kinase [Desulfobacterales bacterium]|nr:MAG: two-component sensor histidine kinase [Desulfobacterales bacterium]